MISSTEIVNKLGKRKFVQYALENQPRGERFVDRERRRSLGKARHRWCEHGKQILKDYESFQFCEKCSSAHVIMEGFEPHFNQALGGFVEDKSDFKKQVKRLEREGWHHLGTDRQ